MKEFFSNKRNIIICVCILAAVVLGTVLILLFTAPKSGKAKLEQEMKELGKNFYENFYYDLVLQSNGIDNIKKFENIGIKVDLDNLLRSNNDEKFKAEDFKNGDKECNKANTKVVIYPKDPFNKQDYKLEVELDCGFEE